jgi:hypothetical protein
MMKITAEHMLAFTSESLRPCHQSKHTQTQTHTHAHTQAHAHTHTGARIGGYNFTNCFIHMKELVYHFKGIMDIKGVFKETVQENFWI